MTTLALDIRGPIIVAVGAFNPAIFSQSWIATNVFGVSEGSEIAVLEVIVQVDPQSILQLRFIEGIAINATHNRIEFYVANKDPATFTAAENALRKVLELLPHTPVQALGCNLRWVDSDPSENMIDLFDSPEGLEGTFKVQAKQFAAQILHEDVVLNFSRASANGEVQFSFNYHRPVTNADECRLIAQDMIRQDMEHSTGMMMSLYGYGTFETLGYATDNQQGEIDHATEAAD